MNRSRPIAVAVAALALVGLMAACGGDDESRPRGAFEFVPLEASGTATRDALKKGDIEVAVFYSSDGVIAKNHWIQLKDDKHLQPIDNFVAAVNTGANTPAVDAVLDAVSEKLTTPKVQQMVASVAVDGENPADVAAKYLEDVTVPAGATGDLKVGFANFAESEIVGNIFQQALKASGANATLTGAGAAREATTPLLESGEIDVMPEFVGSLSLYLDPNVVQSSDVDTAMATARGLAEPKNITLLDPAPADSVNTFVITQSTADQYNLESVSDLAKVKDSLRFGGPPECPERQQCIKGLKDVYGLKFKD